MAVTGWVTCLGCGNIWPVRDALSISEAANAQPMVDGGGMQWRPRVLLAEDDDIFRDTTATAIRSLRVDVDLVVDGVQAVDAFRRCVYDLVLIDYFMPRMSGREAVLAMRRSGRPGADAIPILVFSSIVDDLMHLECLQVGASLVLDKAVGLDGLRIAVSANLPSRTAARESARATTR
jgi:CheY-like chemotaxis protein